MVHAKLKEKKNHIRTSTDRKSIFLKFFHEKRLYFVENKTNITVVLQMEKQAGC